MFRLFSSFIQQISVSTDVLGIVVGAGDKVLNRRNKSPSLGSILKEEMDSVGRTLPSTLSIPVTDVCKSN